MGATQKLIHRIFRRSFRRGVNSGIAAAGEIYELHDFKDFLRNPQEDMRSDWRRIGDDMRLVIARERARITGGTE